MGTQTLVERHVINQSHPYFKACQALTTKSKNLYNSTLYVLRQAYFNHQPLPNYPALTKQWALENQKDYRALPAQVSQSTMQAAFHAMDSFFALSRKQKQGKYTKPVHFPNYLGTSRGKYVVHYTKQALSLVKNPGCVTLSKTNMAIPYRCPKERIQFARIVPRGNHYMIEVGYKQPVPKALETNGRYASVDLGINNLMTVASNVADPFILNGKPIVSINHYYNQRIDRAKSKLPHALRTSHYIDKLFQKRSQKLTTYLHKASRLLVNYLVSNHIHTVIIGYNPGWKQNTRLGKKNNRKFYGLPFLQLVRQIQYKCALVGIRCMLHEESYTSKCSFLDKEPIAHHENYHGKRIKRGLFRSHNGTLINADLNGALNIMRKGLKTTWNDQLWSDCVKACSTPRLARVTPSD